MTNNSFDRSEITLEQAIDRLSKALPVFAKFQDGSTHIIRSHAGEEVFVVTHASLSSARPLADVVSFSSIDNSPIKSAIDIDDQFDDEDSEITVL
jgi:hypothetical protein